MKKIIRKILKEDRRQIFLDKIIKFMKNDFPLFKNMEDYGLYDRLSEDELNYVLSSLFGKHIILKGDWQKTIYDKNGEELYFEDSNGYWEKYEYDENGNNIYYEDSNGYWWKKEYDENNRRTYYEKSDGYWVKYEYSKNGNILYREDSVGNIRDNR